MVNDAMGVTIKCGHSENQGFPSLLNSKIYNTKTGEEIEGITHVEIVMPLEQAVKAKITVLVDELDIEAFPIFKQKDSVESDKRCRNSMMLPPEFGLLVLVKCFDGSPMIDFLPLRWRRLTESEKERFEENE